MTDLSPAAQAVLDAVVSHPEFATRKRIAAALRAAADQVVPFPGRYPLNEYMEGMREAKREVRDKLLDIAAELEALPE